MVVFAYTFYMPSTLDVQHPVTICHVMLNFAALYDVSKETCLLGTGIDEHTLSEIDGVISRAQEMCLIENLIQALPDEPALGFKLGLQYNVSTFGVWGFAMRTSRTLRDAARLAIHYLPLSTAYCEMELFEQDGRFGVSFDPSSIPLSLRQFLLERDIGTAINLLRELGLSGVDLSVLEFQGAELEYRDVMAASCGLAPQFGASRNSLIMSSQDADRPMPTYNPQLVSVFDEQCRQLLRKRQSSGAIESVRQHLLGSMGLVATLEEISEAMSMSPRSLRRKLESEGATFKTIREEERQALAVQLLASSDMKLDGIAFHLGYADTASFNRAFRRWLGCAPGEYRRRQLS